ncbi:hypothetical protein K1719_007763 [Acacia pycnantha]|nr:hypothetical protein K1719_007763 [Acacia pycnantha]
MERRSVWLFPISPGIVPPGNNCATPSGYLLFFVLLSLGHLFCNLIKQLYTLEKQGRPFGKFKSATRSLSS